MNCNRAFFGYFAKFIHGHSSRDHVVEGLLWNIFFQAKMKYNLHHQTSYKSIRIEAWSTSNLHFFLYLFASVIERFTSKVPRVFYWGLFEFPPHTYADGWLLKSTLSYIFQKEKNVIKLVNFTPFFSRDPWNVNVFLPPLSNKYKLQINTARTKQMHALHANGIVFQYMHAHCWQKIINVVF